MNTENLIATVENMNKPNPVVKFAPKLEQFTKIDIKKVLTQYLDPSFQTMLENLNEHLKNYWVKEYSRPKKSTPIFKELPANETGNRAVVSFSTNVEGEIAVEIETIANQILPNNYEIKREHKIGGKGRQAEDSLWIQRKLTDTEISNFKQQFPDRPQ